MSTKYQLRLRLALLVMGQILAFAVPIGAESAHATSVVADPSFGSNGVTEFGVSPTESGTSVVDVAVDNQGRHILLISVVTSSDGSSSAVVIRTLASGAADTTFSDDGRTEVIRTITAQSMAVLSDGKVIVAGELPDRNGMGAVQINEDGTINSDFGIQGLARTPLFGSRMIQSPVRITLRPDNGFVVATGMNSLEWNNSEFIFVAFNSEGIVNGDFGTAGIATVAPTRQGASRFNALMDIGIQSNNKIVAVSTGMNNGDGVTWLIRLTDGGILDTTFDGSNSGNGIVEIRDSHTSDLFMTSLIVNSDDSMVLGGINGTYYTGPHYLASLMTFPSGVLVDAYGTHGISTTNIGGTNITPGKFVKSVSGKYFLTGTTDLAYPVANTQTAYVISFGALGSLDTSFDADGVKVIPNATNAHAWSNSVASNADGSIIIGVTQRNAEDRFQIIRLSSAGNVDNSYGTSGQFSTAINAYSHDLSGQWVMQKTDGKLVVVSNVLVDGNPFFGIDLSFAVEIVQLNANGTIDTTFGTDGHIRLKDPSHSTVASDLYIQPNGKILLAVSMPISTGISDSGIYRLNGNGSLDTTFDGDGYQLFDVGSTDWIACMEAKIDGSIFVGGQSSDAQGNSQNWFASLHSDGSINTLFDGDSGTDNGVVSLHDFYAYDFVAVSDGFVLVGTDINGNAAITKLDVQGRVATSFATSGSAFFPTSNGNGGNKYSWLGYVVPRPNGGFISIGATSYNGSTSPLLIAFDASGILDSSFDGPNNAGNGIVEFEQPSTGNVFQANTVSLDGDGFLLAGNVATAVNGDLSNLRPVLRRVTPSGTFDSAFGVSGQLRVTIGGSGAGMEAKGAIFASDGGIVVFGSHQTDSVYGQESFVTKLVSPQTTTSTSSSSTSSTTSSTTSTSIPNGSSSQPTISTTTTSVVNQPISSSTTTVAVLKVPQVAVGKSISRSSLLSQFRIAVPKGSKLAMTVSTKGFCSIVGTSVKALKKGSCSVQFTVTPSKGTAKRYSRTFKVT